MKSKLQEVTELADAALQVIERLKPSGISVPFIQINVACGALDRVTKHFQSFLAELPEGQEVCPTCGEFQPIGDPHRAC